MWYAEYVGRLDRGMERVGFGDAMVIGAAQALALFPGVSRSGITITEGLFPRPDTRGSGQIFVSSLRADHCRRCRSRFAETH